MKFLFGETGDQHAKKGLEAANQGNFRQAVLEIETAFRKGIKTHKKHELLVVLGRAFQQIGENEKAIDVCKQATQIAPDYPAAWNIMGIAYRSLGRMDDSEACYLHAIQLDPNYVYAQASLGALYIHTGKAEQAKSILEQAIKVNPSLNVAHGNLALAYAMLGRFEDANASLKQAIALGYKTWKEVSERIQALAASKQLQQAQEKRVELEPVADFPFIRYPSSAHGSTLTKEADQLLAAGQRREAINIYKKVLSIEPNCSYVLVQCGLAFQEENRVADAIQYYLLAIKIDPEFGHAYYARGWAKNFLGDYQGELDDARFGLSLDSQNPGPYLRRIGAAYTGMKNFQAALEAYSQAIELNSKDAGTFYNKGLCYSEIGEYENAVREFTTALEIDPDWDWALLSRAKAYQRLGERRQAILDVNEILRLYPDHPRAQELKKIL